MAEPKNIHLIELDAGRDSKIQHVSLYTGLAELTRICKIKLEVGSNKVVFSGLPNVMLQESLRVEGRGSCIIHEVSISQIPIKAPTIKSPKLSALVAQRDSLVKSRSRTNMAISAVNKYQTSFSTKTLEVKSLISATVGADTVVAQLDDKLLEINEKLDEVTKDIAAERKLLGETNESMELRQRVTVMIYAEKECEVDLVLIYGVREATWIAVYDIYASMDTKEKPVSLIYKAGITQFTGEAWSDISLTLETATPTFGVSIPTLQPHILKETVLSRPMSARKSSVSFGRGGRPGGRLTALRQQKDEAMGALCSFDGIPEDEQLYGDGPVVFSRHVQISSKGGINATFTIPGFTSIPSDGAVHNVTVTELDLDANMSWITVPKINTKVYLTAKVKNESEFTLIKGSASVYVNGSFISRSDVPAVSPQESFDCPLGIDPSIRVAYHPRTKKVTRTGFTRKTSSYVFEQRIGVTNTKASAVPSLKVLDQFPVSEDSTISVNCLSPALTIPQPNKDGEYLKTPKAVSVNEQVTAQWEGVDEIAPSEVGKNGSFAWSCEVPPQGKLTLVSSWEVVCPAGTEVQGLNDDS